MKQHNFENGQIYAFDCYCKRVMKNETKRFYNKLNCQKCREVLFSELTHSELHQLFTYDTYFRNDNTFNVCEYRVYICNNNLVEALNELHEQVRDIILLYYIIGITDSEIGKRLSLSRATVQYRRNRALRLLRKIITQTSKRARNDRKNSLQRRTI